MAIIVPASVSCCRDTWNNLCQAFDSEFGTYIPNMCWKKTCFCKIFEAPVHVKYVTMHIPIYSKQILGKEDYKNNVMLTWLDKPVQFFAMIFFKWTLKKHFEPSIYFFVAGLLSYNQDL